MAGPQWKPNELQDDERPHETGHIISLMSTSHIEHAGPYLSRQLQTDSVRFAKVWPRSVPGPRISGSSSRTEMMRRPLHGPI